MNELEILRRRLDRERTARNAAEAMLEARSRELYNANQILVDAQDDLERRVYERTEQLGIATELLKEAAEHSEAANLAKSDFLARMSHEIRTPMNCVIGLTEVLLDTELSDLQRDYLQTIRSSSDSLLGIINDILDFSRIEAGKLTICPAEFSVRTQIDQIVRPLALRAQQKNLEMVVNIAQDVPHIVIGDSARISQVLINLIGNAIKFTPEGYVSLNVEMQYRMQDSAVLRFRIGDSGIGIEESELDDIFRPFDQGEQETVQRFGGSGLGLAICHQLIELMGGEISVSTTYGAGSEFTVSFELPVISFNYQPDLDALSAIRSRRILVLSPSAQLRTHLEECCHEWRCECVVIRDVLGFRLMMHEQRHAPAPLDVILIDNIGLHEDHISFFTDVRSHQPNCHLVLLDAPTTPNAQSGAEIQRSSNLQQAAEANGLRMSLLIKPVYPEQLLNHLYRQLVLNKTGAARAETQAMLPHGLRILLVEDNAVNRKVVRAMLHNESVFVTEALNGKEAVTRVASTKFDVVLMDLRMPIMGGLEATQQIRAMSNLHAMDLPIIALTATAMESERQKCLSEGMDDFLSKPFTKQQLADCVDRLVTQTGAAAGTTIKSSPRDTRTNRASVPAPKPTDLRFETPSPRPQISVDEAIQSTNQPTLFDSDFALRQLGGNLNLLAELCCIFEEDFQVTDAKLQTALRNGVRDQIGLHAHSIKGSLKSLGGTSVAATAGKLEDGSETGTIEDIQCLADELRDQVESFQAELRSFVDSSEHTGM